MTNGVALSSLNRADVEWRTSTRWTPPRATGVQVLARNDVPQADLVDRVIAVVAHVCAGGSCSSPPGFEQARDRTYYVRAARALRLIDDTDDATELGRAVVRNGHPAFAEAFAASPVGTAWVAWAGVPQLKDVDPVGAVAFLAACTDLGEETRKRRAITLRRWMRTLYAGENMGRRPGRPVGSDDQLNLGNVADETAAPSPEPATWPDPFQFPHNEAGQGVARVVAPDMETSPNVLVITGYAALDHVVRFVAERVFVEGGRVRLLFGNEPYAPKVRARYGSRRDIGPEMRDYWLEHGVSVSLCAPILRARDAVQRGDMDVRIARRDRPVHAKVYVTDEAVTLGSSNFTDRGFGFVRQAEANVRFDREEPDRLAEAQAFGEALWTLGIDFKEGLLRLLDELLRAVTWQEALARACAALLEGEWARKYIPPDEIDRLDPKLWPHQLQGISQALWILENVGSVLIADATGSGKTRMGAWLLRGAYDRQLATGLTRRTTPAVIAPPQVIDTWEKDLNEAKLNWRVHSHGPLSQANAYHHEGLVRAVADTELLAVDEAHNFLNPGSDRTRRLLAHYADRAILFTATPINRGATDLLGMIELLGADNLDDSALDVLNELQKLRRGSVRAQIEADTDRIRDEIKRFVVRRTRTDLNRVADHAPGSYVLKSGRKARYPAHVAKVYDCPATDADLAVADEIVALTEMLTGVARVGQRLELPWTLAIEGWDEERYLKRVVSSAAALAKHVVLDCLRSSRVALVEHIHGTEAAWKAFYPSDEALPRKQSTGNTAASLRALGGQLPRWDFRTLPKESAPEWLRDEAAHRAACATEAAIYEKIAELAGRLSDARERAKADHLARLGHDQLVIAFDAHIISLTVFERDLRARGVPVELFTGAGGMAAKKKAKRLLGLASDETRMVALCSDVLSEGVNLQRASSVVHLDTPTVIRTAEQRAGRVDRMDSPHDTVAIWFPRDPPSFAPRRRDLLRERHDMVADLIGANLKLPELEGGSEPLPIETLANAVETGEFEDPTNLYDAFRPVRDLIGAGGLVTQRVYDEMRTSQAEVVARVSPVRSSSAWAFLAVGAIERNAPRWVFLEDPGAAPEVDLARIVEALRSRLQPDMETLTIDDHAQGYIDRFLERVRVTERGLLPVRRQRALSLAERVLDEYARSSWTNTERGATIRGLLDVVRADTARPHPDPRSVAEAWLRLIRPRQRAALEKRRNRRTLWRLDLLFPDLVKDPLDAGAMERAFANIPILQPVSERVVAMIVGVPSDSA